MTIFNILNSLLYTKKDVEINVDDENIFNLYMINRWCSMYSPEMNKIINQFSNRLNVFESKQDQYHFLKNLLPKVKFKKINYIKKVKEDKENEEQKKMIKDLAKNKELSQREVEQYLKFTI